jgi:hypothetical protein
MTTKSTGELIFELLSKKLKVNFFIGNKIKNKIVSEFNAFNNPENDINFHNNQDWQIAEVPSINGHRNARAIAKIYDVFVNDLILEKNILLSKLSISKCLTKSVNRINKSLMMPI